MASIVSVLHERYGVGPVAAPVEAVLWAAEHFAETVGVEVAKEQLQALNRIREKHGAVPAYPSYGDKLF